MNLGQVRSMLEKAVDDAGGPAAWADKHSISRDHVVDVLAGAAPGSATCHALGLEEVRFYRRTPNCECGTCRGSGVVEGRDDRDFVIERPCPECVDVD